MLRHQGFHLVPGACLGDLDKLRREADDMLADGHAARNVLRRSSHLAHYAMRWGEHPLIHEALGRPAFAIRGLLFDKIPGANWQVPWHQDRLIAVCKRIDLPGWGPWSVKDGVQHVDPPEPWLHRRLAIRLHLDDCPADNGALQVIAGSHEDDSLTPANSPPQIIEAMAGDVLVMHPLLLHASAPSRTPRRRRILHIEYACDPLPGGLHWEAVNDPSPTPPLSCAGTPQPGFPPPA